MRYEEIVEKVRNLYERHADARDIFEHIAVQVNIIGEGSGAFYIEIAHRQITVEPYDYYDRDILVTVDGTALIEMTEGKLSTTSAIEQKRLMIEGNPEKIEIMKKIRFY